jgi:hypothetical protein
VASRLDGLILEAIHGRSGSSIVDIPTILERVDSDERWVLTFDELDSGLRRLSEAGRIGESSVGRYVVAGSRHPTHPYSGLSLERYEAAVTAYRTAFAADAVWLMRSPLFRAPVALLRSCYRLTGGRFGLAPEWVDLDAIAIAFAVEGVVSPMGAETGDLSLEGDALIVPVLEGDAPLDRVAVLDGVRVAIRRHKLRRRVVLRFHDRDEVAEST